uniref:Adrenomedullin 5 (putative) n=1 Tax=Catagonus wagneri TaxID=51154 RepID=A0A8C3WC28_9CETA
MTAYMLLLLLFASSILGDPDSAGRLTRHQVSQQRGRFCSLGTCQTHRLPEIIYWLRCLHEGALREGWPQASGPPQLWAPPAAARGQNPAAPPGPPPVQGPTCWMTLGTSHSFPGLSLPICVLKPWPQVSFPLTPRPGLSPGCSW